MQKLCCVRTRQHPLPVWSHKFVLSSTTHISTNSRPFLVGSVSRPLRSRNIRTRKRRRRDKVQNHNAPNGCPTMRNPKTGNFPASGCGMETNGIGVPKKQEVNVRDDGSVTLPQVAKGRHLKVSIKRVHLRTHLNQRKLKRKAREGRN